MARRCERCSAVMSDDDQFCGECGLPSSYDAAGQPEVVARERPVNYTEVSGDPSYDPLSNLRFFVQYGRQVVLFWVLNFFLELGLFIICLLLGVAGLGILRGFALWEIVGTVGSLVLWGFFWFTPVPALVGQHSRLLRQRAPSAEAVLASVRESIIRHETPADSLTTRVITPPGERSRTYLELRRGVFCGMVSSFPYGRDLYAGWTFWISMSPFRLVLMFIGRLIQDYTGRGNDIYQTLRWESARAAIGAIHSSLEEVTGELVPDGGTDGGWPPLVPRPAPPVRPSRSRA